MTLDIPQEVLAAAALLGQAGRQAYLVGGALRDDMLGLKPKDWDLATEARPEELISLFQRRGINTIPTGMRFGTVTVLMGNFPLEITTFRSESEYRDFRRPDSVSFSSSIIEDLQRRDFTINAMALNLATFELVDPFGGRGDLARGVIRTVGRPSDRFSEDPLRMLRGYRIASELGFHMENAAGLALAALSDLIRKVSPERIQGELCRVLEAPYCYKALEEMALSGLLFQVIPELFEGWAYPQRHPAHSWSVFQHILESVRYTPGRLLPRLAALLHDIGKPRCFSAGDDDIGHFYGHDLVSARLAGGVLRRLRWDNRTRKKTEALVRWHMFPLTMAARGIRRLVLRIGWDLMDDLLALKQADILATGPSSIDKSMAAMDSFRQRLEEVRNRGEAIGLTGLAVDGREVMRILGLPPGPVVGKVLELLHREVLEDPTRNSTVYLRARLKSLIGRNPLPPGE